MKENKRRHSGRLNPLALKKVSPRAVSQKRAAAVTGSGRGGTRLGNFIRRYLPKRFRNTYFTWRHFFITVAGFFAVLLVTTAVIFAITVRNIPNPRQLSERPISQSTKILDRNGKSLYSFYGDVNRTLIPGDQISQYAKMATIAVEDADFYNHHGINIKGILRAIYGRFSSTRLAGGGSTITQQYVKKALLTDEQTLTRKFKDMILAIEVEQRYSKDEILTGYLNEIPYGGSAYGIETAAQTYFGKSAKTLTLSEAATLAAIPQAPTYYSPYGSHLDDLFERKDYVLNRMAKVGFITQEEADAAKTESPSAENPNFKSNKSLAAQHFIFYVRQKLIDYIGGDPSEAELQLDNAGYTVTTSLDMDTQTMAQSVLAEMGPGVVKKYNASNAALSAVDPKTGEIIAMVGSIDYEDSKSGNTNFANALLQPGSSFKPIVYATAFNEEHKYSPASITYDLPTDFGNYRPLNYDQRFRGPTTNRDALATSLNIPAVKNLQLATLNDSLDTAKALGITSLNSPDKYGLSLVLGSGEVRPVEMAGAYATFANEGKHNALRPILKIEKDGQVIKDFTQEQATQAITPEVAYQISNILSDNKARTPVFGANNSLTLKDRPVAAKTGTTNNNRDAWTIGYTPQIAVSVWVGNNEPNKTMTKGADGSYVAAPIWKSFMEKYHSGKPVQDFVRPSTIVDFTIDKLSGKIPTDQSPTDQHVTDIFAPWQLPEARFGKDKMYDDVHIKVKIDKLTGKLATDLTPAQNIEERIYFVVHSEIPNNPNWENPVQEWAHANGGGILPPTESSDIYTEDNRPTLQITSPTEGSTVSGSFTIATNPGGSKPVTSVEFFINNISIGVATQAPWSVGYSADNLPSGTQIITATVTNDIGLTRSVQVTVVKSSQAQGDTSPPGPVTGLKATNGSKATNKPIVLSWQNPADADLSKIIIYQSQTAGTLGTPVKTITANPGSAGTTEIANLAIGTYYFTVHTVDSSQNENTAAVTIAAQMLP